MNDHEGQITSGRISVCGSIYLHTDSEFFKNTPALRRKSYSRCAWKAIPFFNQAHSFLYFQQGSQIPCLHSIIFSISPPTLSHALGLRGVKADRSSVFAHSWAGWLRGPGASMGTYFTVLKGWSVFAVRQLDLRFGKLLLLCLKGHVINFPCKVLRTILGEGGSAAETVKDVFSKKSSSNRRSLKILEFSRQCERFCWKITYVNKQDVPKLPSVPSEFSIVLVQYLPLMLYNGSETASVFPVLSSGCQFSEIFE